MDGGKPVFEQVPDQIVHQCSENLFPYFQPAPGPAKGDDREQANGLGRFQGRGEGFQVR
jgi:hypothetical protein